MFLLIASVLIVIMMNKINAQQVYQYQEPTSNMGVAIQAGLALPVGSFSDEAGLGVGGEGTFEYRFNPQFGLDVSVGFYSWGSKNDLLPGNDYKIADIPIMAGVKYLLLASDFHPYVGAALGMHFLNTRVTVANVSETSTTDTKFGFAPMAGIRLHMPPNLDLDLNVKYNIISDANYISIIAGAQVAL